MQAPGLTSADGGVAVKDEGSAEGGWAGGGEGVGWGDSSSRADPIAHHACPDFGHKVGYEPCIFRNICIKKRKPYFSHCINTNQENSPEDGLFQGFQN